MDTLIQKWKNNPTVGLSGSRYSESKPKQADSDSSSSNSPKQKSATKPIKQLSPPQKNIRNNLKQTSASLNKLEQPHHHLGSSDKKSTNTTSNRPPTFTASLDTCTYHIVQLSKQQLPQAKLIENIKHYLVDFAENLQALGSPGFAVAQVEELKSKITQQEQQIAQLKNSSREEISRRLIGELEDKLLESEKQRVKQKQQKESMQIQFEKLQEQLNKVQVSQELLHQIKQENNSLKKNNEILLMQVNQLNCRDKEQQQIWSQQVDDLMKMMDILKLQLQTNN